MACGWEDAASDMFWEWYNELDISILIETLEKEGYRVIPPEE